MIYKFLFLFICILGMFSSPSHAQANDTLVRLGINELWVVNIDVLSKEYDGICDCSVGNKKRSNECSLFKIKITKLFYQADSARMHAGKIFELDSVISNEKYKSKLKVGQKYLVVLGLTTSDEYLQVVNVLDDKFENRYKFSQHAYLTSFDCKDKKMTIKRK